MSTPTDHELVLDEEVEPADRVAAMTRLLDGPTAADYRPILESWLIGENEFLREEALVALLTRLKLEEYVNVATGWLGRDGDPFAACAAAHALGSFVLATGRRLEEVCSTLTEYLRSSNDQDVQRACYLGVLAALGEPVAAVPGDFDRSRDVDWSRLQRFLVNP